MTWQKGAIPEKDVSSRTNILVIGDLNPVVLTPGATTSGKAARAFALQSKGQDIEVMTALAIVDYKTSTDEGPEADADYALQLAVYADAGRREGLNVRGAYVHDLKEAGRKPVDVTSAAIQAAETEVESSVRELRERRFRAKPGRPCKRCDLRALCRWG